LTVVGARAVVAQAVENQKFFNGGLDRQPQPEDESEFVDAFVALGGKADRSGSIELARLMGVLEVSRLSLLATARRNCRINIIIAPPTACANNPAHAAPMRMGRRC